MSEVTDRELLELAAKAAGLRVAFSACDECMILGPGDNGVERYDSIWNPLTDDGAALRLAVRLNLQVTPGTYRDHEATAFHAGKGEAHEHVHYKQDLYAATRRAIVRAAAEIGAAHE